MQPKHYFELCWGACVLVWYGAKLSSCVNVCMYACMYFFMTTTSRPSRCDRSNANTYRPIHTCMFVLCSAPAQPNYLETRYLVSAGLTRRARLCKFSSPIRESRTSKMCGKTPRKDLFAAWEEACMYVCMYVFMFQDTRVHSDTPNGTAERLTAKGMKRRHDTPHQ